MGNVEGTRWKRCPSLDVYRTKPSQSLVFNFKKGVAINIFDCSALKWYTSQKHGNYIISPVNCLLSMEIMTAEAKWGTLAAVAKAVQLPTDCKTSFQVMVHCLKEPFDKNVLELKMATKSYVTDCFGLEPIHQILLDGSFEADIENINDFCDKGAIHKINKWAKAATGGNVSNLIDGSAATSAQGCSIINCVYFKGRWAAEFDAALTKNETFFSDRRDKSVAMMKKINKYQHAYLQDLAAQLLIVPFKMDTFCMILVLPDKKFGLGELEKKIFNKNLRELAAAAALKDVYVQIPRLDIKYESIHLDEQQAKLGVDIMCNDQMTHNKLFGSKNKRVTHVPHMRLKTADSEPPVLFRCDHPFYYFLAYKTDFCLFAGRITNPTKGK
ncbi:serine protease inhibitor 42Dd-like isoform X2 [Cloeon dipterum]|uniref:serine protease inhibitor 42Dd-like isoform X2 n=1 Tax=Cloeon dipterum TaxID=197152 RepID=UPI00321FEB1D